MHHVKQCLESKLITMFLNYEEQKLYKERLLFIIWKRKAFTKEILIFIHFKKKSLLISRSLFLKIQCSEPFGTIHTRRNCLKLKADSLQNVHTQKKSSQLVRWICLSFPCLSGDEWNAKPFLLHVSSSSCCANKSVKVEYQTTCGQYNNTHQSRLQQLSSFD